MASLLRTRSSRSLGALLHQQFHASPDHVAGELSGAGLNAGSLGRPWRTRFAPAPTGYLHLGHVVNALFVWGIARAYGGEVLLRIEDHDRSRCRPEYELALLDDLDWLGLAPDVGTTAAFRAGRHELRQSDNLERYTAALETLEREGRTYACSCSRKAVAAAAGTTPGEEARYPGTCANLSVTNAALAAQRFRVSDDEVAFRDIRLGPQVQRPAHQCGDFLLRDRNRNFTYQFAVTVDDWQQQIDVVIRGEDLLPSTARQMQLSAALGSREPPRYLHHGLVLRADGRKLSKSLGDEGVPELRERGATPEAVLGRAAFEAGLTDSAAPLALGDVAGLFS